MSCIPAKYCQFFHGQYLFYKQARTTSQCTISFQLIQICSKDCIILKNFTRTRLGRFTFTSYALTLKDISANKANVLFYYLLSKTIVDAMY